MNVDCIHRRLIYQTIPSISRTKEGRPRGIRTETYLSYISQGQTYIFSTIFQKDSYDITLGSCQLIRQYVTSCVHYVEDG